MHCIYPRTFGRFCEREGSWACEKPHFLAVFSSGARGIRKGSGEGAARPVSFTQVSHRPLFPPSCVSTFVFVVAFPAVDYVRFMIAPGASQHVCRPHDGGRGVTVAARHVSSRGSHVLFQAPSLQPLARLSAFARWFALSGSTWMPNVKNREAT